MDVMLVQLLFRDWQGSANGTQYASEVIELANGAWAWLQLLFTIFLLIYIYRTGKENGMTLGVRVAVAVLVFSLGSLVFHGELFIWRRFYPESGIRIADLSLLALAGMTAAVGLLMKIRIYTAPFYGTWPFRVALATTIAMIAAAAWWR